MNAQGLNCIEWTDYTWNPVGGCKHACRWTMPDGSVAKCYAETTAEGTMLRPFYPQGFGAHYWHPDRLDEPLKLKKPVRIFLDSMSDLMGHWVPDEQVQAVLDVCRRAHWHTFQLLTKNAPRLTRFQFPANVWVGVSAPPSQMLGHTLTPDQQLRMLARQIDALASLPPYNVGWMSIEPLSWDIQLDMAALHSVIGQPVTDFLDWIVIGAATNGRTVYQPEPEWVENLLGMADCTGIPVFFKSNLRGNPAATPWRQEFPQAVTQQSLF